MKKPSSKALLVAGIPFIAMCFTVPLWDRVYPMVLGLPFNLFWLMLWTLLTPVWLLMAGEIYTTFTFLGASGWAYSRGGPALYILAYMPLAYSISFFVLPPI